MIFIKSLGYEIIYVAVTFKLYIYYIYKALAKVYFVVMYILASDMFKKTIYVFKARNFRNF